MSLFGNPKLTIVCGDCYGQFKTKDYTLDKKNKEIVANCPHCGMWNRTGLVKS